MGPSFVSQLIAGVIILPIVIGIVSSTGKPLSSNFIVFGVVFFVHRFLANLIDRMWESEATKNKEESKMGVITPEEKKSYVPAGKNKCDKCGHSFPSRYYLKEFKGEGYLCEKCRPAT